ncbi:unnamed protein product [Symbiodinium sp. CCMP2592]|nr:unnamed protein product [Symbiodinium sp. CCMP2592]
MTEEDTDRFRLAAPPLFKPVWACREKPDAPRQALLAMLPGSEEAVCSATPLEVSALSALGQLARRSEEQARLILRSPAVLQQSFKILDRCACDEEKVVDVLQFLRHVRAFVPEEVVRSRMKTSVSAAAARLPRSEVVKSLANALVS